jgi:hypothetical protein
MASRAAIILLLMTSKWLPSNISFIFGNRKNTSGARSGESEADQEGVPAHLFVY